MFYRVEYGVGSLQFNFFFQSGETHMARQLLKTPVVEKPRDGIWIVDANACTVYANDRMAEILGTSPSQMVGQPSFTYVFPEDVEQAQRLFEIKKHGGIDPFRFKLRRQDGSSVWVDVQGTPMHNSVGAFKGIVGTFSASS
jgi:PAS domain S-box-containing protein